MKNKLNMLIKTIPIFFVRFFFIRYYWVIRKKALKLFGLKGINEAIRNGTIKRILVTRSQCMGDMIVFIPFLRELRRNLPDSYICVLAEEKLGIETLDGCSYINKIIKFKSEKFLLKRLKQIVSLRKEHFDLFIVSSAETGFAYAGAFMGVKYIIGFDKKIRFGELRAKEDTHLLDVCVKFDYCQNEILQNLKLLKFLNFKNVRSNPEYWIYESDKAYMQRLLYNDLRISPDKIFVGLHPGSKQSTKCWAPLKFARVADFLIKDFGVEVVLIGSYNEMDLSLQVSNLMKYKPIILNGKTTIRQLAALMSELKLFICNDSGPMHMAAAIGLPVVALFGPGQIAHWNCYQDSENVAIIRHNVSCSPCQKMSCQSNECMKLITVNEVYGTAKKILEKKLEKKDAVFNNKIMGKGVVA